MEITMKNKIAQELRSKIGWPIGEWTPGTLLRSVPESV